MNIKQIFLLSWKKLFLSISGIVVSIILHNLVSAVFNTEEALFFILSVFIIPIFLLISIILTSYKTIKNQNRNGIAKIIGVLIIVAYGVIGSFTLKSETAIISLEVISGLAVLGAAVLLYPILKPYSKNLTNSYTLIKVVEGLMIIIGACLLLSSIPQASIIRDWLSEANVYAFGTRFMILYVIFYQSKLVPRFLSIWGLGASVVLMFSFFINSISSFTVSPAISHLPVISNELLLALWLIIKGFKLSHTNTQTRGNRS